MQKVLSLRVIEHDCFNYPPKYICGIDVSYRKGNAIAAASLLNFPELKLVEYSIAHCIVDIPYIPGLLAFRELRPCILAFKKLKTAPDVVLIDAHGRAHPRLFGLACHFGVVMDVPTIGVAKKKLCGQVMYDTRICESLNAYPIIYRGKVVGAALKVGKNKYLYVSIGHKVSLNTALKLVSMTVKHPLMPEPILISHNICKSRRYQLQ